MVHAGKLIGLAPTAPQAVDLQRALTKAVSVPLMMTPPMLEPAVHMLTVLAQAEQAAKSAAADPREPFITFDDTFAKYAELLAHRSSGALAD